MSQLILISDYLNLFTFFEIKNSVREMSNKKALFFSFHSFYLIWLNKSLYLGKRKSWIHNSKERGKKNLLTEHDLYLNSLYYMACLECFDLWCKSHTSFPLSLSISHPCVILLNAPFTGWFRYSHFIYFCSFLRFPPPFLPSLLWRYLCVCVCVCVCVCKYTYIYMKYQDHSVSHSSNK